MTSKSTRDFDPDDEVSYYYGNLNRDHVKEILAEAQIGTFLIRDSTKDFDQKVLCVKEAHGVINSYKIMHTQDETTTTTEEATDTYYIHGRNDCHFQSISEILSFYSTHYLTQSPLVLAAFAHKKVIALFDFLEGGDVDEDLYFKKNDVLKVLEYTQGEHWWNAEMGGKIGLIPATLVRRLRPNECVVDKGNIKSDLVVESEVSDGKIEIHEEEEEAMVCPFRAKVVEDYTPSPYEKSHVALKKGQTVTVLEMQSIGKWYGQVHGADGKIEFDRKGLFPFNRVEIIK